MSALDKAFGCPTQFQLSREDAFGLAGAGDLFALLTAAAARRDAAHGDLISYSPKVFIPLTKLCRDVCHYCTFARPPRPGERAFLTIAEAVAIAEAGKAVGCTEALFTLGDKPELRYRVAREELAALGHETTISYLAEAANAVFKATGLFPHLNPGVMTPAEIAALRDVSLSQGIMLESISGRLCEKGGPHHGSPDKWPEVRLDTIRAAGQLGVPFTTGLLIGIGETREERIDAHPPCAICMSAMVTFTKSSSRISGPSPARAWRRCPPPAWTSSSGRSPWRG
jgi:FO synthase